MHSALALILVLNGVPFQTTLGRIHGRVSDPSGRVISAAVVTMKNAKGETLTARTDDSGAYELKAIPPGQYSFSVSADGFAEYTRDIEVGTAQDQKVDVSL